MLGLTVPLIYEACSGAAGSWVVLLVVSLFQHIVFKFFAYIFTINPE